mgnify:FL=1
MDGPPSRRANATLTACPVKDHLYLFGGEYYDGSTVLRLRTTCASTMDLTPYAGNSTRISIATRRTRTNGAGSRHLLLLVLAARIKWSRRRREEASSGCLEESSVRPHWYIMRGAALIDHLQLRQISNPSCTIAISCVEQLLPYKLTADVVRARSGASTLRLIPGSDSTRSFVPLRVPAIVSQPGSTSSSSSACAPSSSSQGSSLNDLAQGFQDTGVRTSYLSDLWVWDTLEYKWHQIDISDVDRKPGFVPPGSRSQSY